MKPLKRFASPRRVHQILLSLLCLVTALTGRLWADSATWTGGGNPDGQWTNGLNWASGLPPANPLTFSAYSTNDGAVIYNADLGFYDSIISTNWTIGRLAFTNAGNMILSGADLTLAQAQSAGNPGQASIDITGTSTVTISNNLIFPAATNTPTTNIRHQIWALNASTMNFYGNLIKPNDGPGQLTFRGGGNGVFNVYGRILWDTNLVSRTDVSTLGLYNSGNTWTQMNISVGTVLLGVDNALPVNSWLNFNQNSGGASFLRMSNQNQTLTFLSTSTIGNGSNTQVVDTATSSILTLNDNGASNIFGGSIMGGGQFLKVGNGTLVLLTNNSTYTGGTLIGGGTLSLGNGTTGGAITGYITNNATLIVNKSDALTLPNTISGSGQFRKLGTGTLTLPATNTYSGNTTVSNGTMLVTGALTGAGTVGVSGSTLRVDGLLSGSGAVSVFGGGTLMGSGGIAGPVTVFTNGQVQTSVAPNPATLTFSNNLTLNSGGFAAYKFGGPTNVGNGANDLLDVKGNLTLNNNPLVLVPVAPLTVGNTYVMAIVAGTLTGSVGAITNPTRYTFTTSSSGNQVKLTVSGGASSSVLWRGTTANWDLTSSNWLNGATRDKFYQADAVTFDDTATIYTQTLATALYPGAITVNATNNYAFTGSGKLSGATGLTKSSAGTLILSNANDFTGTVLVNGGTLQVGSTTALGVTNGGTVVGNGATLELNGVSLYNPGELITISGTGLNNTGAVINSTLDQNNGLRYLSLATNASVGAWTNRWDVRGPGGNATFSGGLYLNGYTLTKLGTNKMSLVDLVATNGGSIRATAGVLGLTRSLVDGPGFIDGGSALVQIENSSTGYVNKPMLFNGGRLQLIGNAFALGSAITNNGVTVDVASGLTLTLTNLLTGTGSLNKVTAGTLFLQQPDLCSGPTTVSGGTLQLDAGSGLPNTKSIAIASGATLDVSSLASGLSLASGQALSGSGSILGDLTAGPGSIVGPGSSPGTLTVNGNATINSSTLNFELGANPAIGDPGNDSILVNGNLNLNGVTTINIVPIANLGAAPYSLFQFGNLASGGTNNLNIVTQSRYIFTLLDPATTAPFIQVQATGGEGAANLIWQGGAASDPTAWDLKATKNWLKGGTPDVFFSGDTVIFNDTATTNFAALVGNLSPAMVVLSNNVIDYTLGGSGGIASGSLTNWGSRSLRLANAAANTFTALDVENGLVTLANGGVNTFVSGLTLNGGTLNFANADANSFPAGFTLNNGALYFNNAGPNTFDSVFTVYSGDLAFTNGAANNFGPGCFLFGGTLTLANAYANNLGTSPSISGTLLFAQPTDVPCSSAINGGGTILKRATNTLTLAANNGGFSGTLQADNGVLRSGATSALGTGAVVINDGASLDVGGQNCTSPSSVTIRGVGFNSTGVIRNTGADQQSALKNVVLAADSLVGGTGRWDIRGPTSGAFGGTLDLAGFTLRKQGPNKVAIADATLPNDGTIEVLSGTLGITRSQVGGVAPIILGTNILQLENNSTATAVVSKPLVTDRSLIQLVGNSYGINSPITNNGGVTIDVSTLTLTLSNTISGAGTLTKTNTGTLLLNTSNIFTGNINLQAGALQVGHNLALGTSKTLYVTNTTGVTGTTGPTVDLLSNIVTPSSLALTFNTTFNPDIRVSLRGFQGASEWKGPITLTGDGRFGLYADAAGTSLIVSGPINGPTVGSTGLIFIRGSSGVGQLNGQLNFIGQLFKTDAGTWLVNSTSNYWSTTGIAVGTVRLGAHNALCVTAPLTMGQADANAGVLDLNGFNQTIPGLSNTGTGTRRIGNDSTTSDSVFTFAGTNTSTYGGQFVDNVTTNGTRKLSLTVAGGTLYLNGNNTNTGPTLVQTGATLGGNGNLLSSVTVQTGGTLAPGAGSIGRLAISNSLTFAAGSTHLVELNPAPATNDLVVGLSSVSYAGTLVLTNVGSAMLANGATFKLFSAGTYNGAFDNVVSRTPNQLVVWDTSRLNLDGTIMVAQTLSLAPPKVVGGAGGGSLGLSWPADHLGWRLLTETNSLSVGLTTNLADWFYVPGSSTTNAVFLNIDSAQDSIFYRLVYP